MFEKYKNLETLKILNDFKAGLKLVSTSDDFASLFYTYHTTVTKRIYEVVSLESSAFMSSLLKGFIKYRYYKVDFIVQSHAFLNHFIYAALYDSRSLNYEVFFMKLFKMLRRNKVSLEQDVFAEILKKLDSLKLPKSSRNKLDEEILSYQSSVYKDADANANLFIKKSIDSGRANSDIISMKEITSAAGIITRKNQRNAIDVLFNYYGTHLRPILSELKKNISVDKIDYGYLICNLSCSSQYEELKEFIKENRKSLKIEKYKNSFEIADKIFYCYLNENVERSYMAELLYEILVNPYPFKTSIYISWAEMKVLSFTEDLISLINKDNSLLRKVSVIEYLPLEEQIKFYRDEVSKIETADDYNLLEEKIYNIYEMNYEMNLPENLLADNLAETIERAENMKAIAEIYKLLTQKAIEKGLEVVQGSNKKDEFQHSMGTMQNSDNN